MAATKAAYSPDDKRAAMALICDEIASSSKGIKRICEKKQELPDYSQTYRWMLEKENVSQDSDLLSELRQMYAHAKKQQTDYLADEMLDIADDSTADYDADGELRQDNVQRSRLRVETRKWLMGKLNRRKYGEKLDVSHGGTVGVTLEQRLIDARDRVEQGQTAIEGTCEQVD